MLHSANINKHRQIHNYGGVTFTSGFLDGTWYAIHEKKSPFFVLSAKTRDDVVIKAKAAIDTWVAYVEEDEPMIGMFDDLSYDCCR